MNQEGHQYKTTSKIKLFRWLRNQTEATFPNPFIVGMSCCSLSFYNFFRENKLMNNDFLDSPERSQILIVGGSLTPIQVEKIKRVYKRMPDEKWVVAFGACACAQGPYESYNVLGALDNFIDVDIYIPGCPPQPDKIEKGFSELTQMIKRGKDSLHV